MSEPLVDDLVGIVGRLQTERDRYRAALELIGHVEGPAGDYARSVLEEPS